MKTFVYLSFSFFIASTTTFSQLLLNPVEVASFSDLKAEIDTAFTNNTFSFIYPPGVDFEIHGGILAFSSSFETNFLNALSVQDFDSYELRSLYISESTNLPVVRYWIDSSDSAITNTSTSGYVPDNWVLDRFTPPGYFTGQDLEDWKAGFRLSRQTMRVDLIATNQIDAYNIALSNAYVAITNQFPTNVLAPVQFSMTTNPPMWHLTMQAPTNAAHLGVYETVNLLNPFPWFLITELPSDTDPILLSDSLSKERSVLTIANHSLDSDGDGLLDATELLQLGSDLDESDTDGDGLNDFDEVMIYRTSVLVADTDGDGMSDGGEVALGYDPTLANSAPSISIVSPVNGSRWL